MEKLEMELETVTKEQSKRENRMRSAVFRSRKFLRLAGKDFGSLKVNCIAFQKLEGGSYGNSKHPKPLTRSRISRADHTVIPKIPNRRL